MGAGRLFRSKTHGERAAASGGRALPIGLLAQLRVGTGARERNRGERADLEGVRFRPQGGNALPPGVRAE